MNMAVTAFLNDLFNALSLGAVLVLMPLGVGFLFFRKNERDRGLVYIIGMCAMLAAFELVYLPFFFLRQRFTLLTAVYFVLAIAASVVYDGKIAKKEEVHTITGYAGDHLLKSVKIWIAVRYHKLSIISKTHMIITHKITICHHISIVGFVF